MSKIKKELNKIDKKQIELPSIEGLEEAFSDDLDLMVFFVTWLKKGLNATEAYKELHPNVTHGSAEVLGSRLLGKVKPSILLSVYGLGVDTYFRQLSEGMDATKWNDFTGEREPDHNTRRKYHETLGKLLNIEKSDNKQVNVAIGLGVLNKKEYDW